MKFYPFWWLLDAFNLSFSIPPTRKKLLTSKSGKMGRFPALLSSRVSRGRSGENRSRRRGGIFSHFCMKTFRHIWVNKSLNFQLFRFHSLFTFSDIFSSAVKKTKSDALAHFVASRRSWKVCDFFFNYLKKCNVTISWCLKMKHFSRSSQLTNFFTFFFLDSFKVCKSFFSHSAQLQTRVYREVGRRREGFKKLQ